MGWDPEQKRAELFHPASRFILLFEGCDEPMAEDLIAFTMFRFEEEPDFLSVLVSRPTPIPPR